jgi:hypothetical protein
MPDIMSSRIQIQMPTTNCRALVYDLTAWVRVVGHYLVPETKLGINSALLMSVSVNIVHKKGGMTRVVGMVG